MPSFEDEPSDPLKYCKRDLLALMQLLHDKGLIDPVSVTEDAIASSNLHTKWFNLPSTQLSLLQGLCPLLHPPSPHLLCSLYKNLLQEHPHCKNTTDLANFFYFSHVEELENVLLSKKEQFYSLLEQEAND